MSFKPTPVTNIDLNIVPNLNKLTIYDGYELSNNSLATTSIHGLGELYIEDAAFTIFTPNKFTSLNKLTLLRATSLQAIDLTNNTLLTYVDCDNSQLSSNNIFTLDLSANVNLSYISLVNNGLTSLDISNNTNIDTLILTDNSLTIFQVDRILQKLVEFGNSNGIVYLDNVSGGTNQAPSSMTHVNTLLARGWDIKTEPVAGNGELPGFMNVEELTSSSSVSGYIIPYTGSDETVLFKTDNVDIEYIGEFFNIPTSGNFGIAIKAPVYSEIETIEIGTQTGCNIVSFDLREFTELKSFNISDQNIQSLDFSNTKVFEALVTNNGLNTINLGPSNNLLTLDINTNNISELDIRYNTELTSAIANDNNLTSLNISRNTKLEEINVSSNSLFDTFIIDAGPYHGPTDSLLSLIAGNTSLSSIDISSFVNLEHLELNDTNVSSIVTNSNTVLNYLNLQNTNINTLDISNNPLLTTLLVNGSNCSRQAIDNILVNLDDFGLENGTLNILGYSFTKYTELESLLEKGWIVTYTAPIGYIPGFMRTSISGAVTMEIRL